MWSTAPLKAATWLAFATSLSSATPQYGAPPKIQFKHWPEEAATALSNMITKNANQSNYAVFDMDNTSYRYDLEESLLPFLENRGILTRDNLDPSLKLVDFKDTANFTESLYSYYNRLYWDGDEVTSSSVNPPKVFRGQAELYNALMDNGIAVYVISAAHEELVRMVASDPKYGYNVPPQNVIGVTTVLKNTTSGALTNARKQITEGTYNETANLDLVVTPYLWSGATWFAGKWAAILTYIDQWKRPVLAGGDTPGSDSYMQFHGVDVAKGGVHLWINRRDAYFEQLQEEIRNNTQAQIANGREVTADKNWVVVTPEEIL